MPATYMYRRHPCTGAQVEIFADAVAIKVGRSVAFYEISLLDADDTLVARATQTTVRLPLLPTSLPHTHFSRQAGVVQCHAALADHVLVRHLVSV